MPGPELVAPDVTVVKGFIIYQAVWYCIEGHQQNGAWQKITNVTAQLIRLCDLHSAQAVYPLQLHVVHHSQEPLRDIESQSVGSQ